MPTRWCAILIPSPSGAGVSSSTTDARPARRSLRPLLTHEHVAIDIDALRRDEPVDPFEALIDHQDARAIWKHRRWNLCERVSRQPKAWIRRRLIAALREQVLAAGGLWMRLAPFPHPLSLGLQFPGRPG